MTIVDIKQYDINQSAVKVEIEIIQYILNTSAICNVNFMDSTDKKISSVLVAVDGQDFETNWNTDDDLINIVLNKLGLSKLSFN